MDDPTVGSQVPDAKGDGFRIPTEEVGRRSRHYKNREPRRDNPPWLSFVRVSDRHGGLSLRTHFPMNSGFEEKD